MDSIKIALQNSMLSYYQGYRDASKNHKLSLYAVKIKFGDDPIYSTVYEDVMEVLEEKPQTA